MQCLTQPIDPFRRLAPDWSEAPQHNNHVPFMVLTKNGSIRNAVCNGPERPTRTLPAGEFVLPKGPMEFKMGRWWCPLTEGGFIPRSDLRFATAADFQVNPNLVIITLKSDSRRFAPTVRMGYRTKLSEATDSTPRPSSSEPPVAQPRRGCKARRGVKRFSPEVRCAMREKLQVQRNRFIVAFFWFLECCASYSPRDQCFVDALRGIGIQAPYCQEGGYWAQKDGDRVLAPFGKRLIPVLPPKHGDVGRYLVHTQDHFTGLRLHEDECVLCSGESKIDVENLEKVTSKKNLRFFQLRSKSDWAGCDTLPCYCQACNALIRGTAVEQRGEGPFHFGCVDASKHWTTCYPYDAFGRMTVDLPKSPKEALERLEGHLQEPASSSVMPHAGNGQEIFGASPYAGRPRLADGVICNPPSDGFCLYHLVCAARDLTAFMHERDAHGRVGDRDRQRRDEQAAYDVRNEIIALARQNDDEGTAVRLHGNGKQAEPGMDELKYIAELLGGAVELVNTKEPLFPPIKYGKGPLVARVNHMCSVDGAGSESEHWSMLQCWMSDVAERSVAGPDREVLSACDNALRNPDGPAVQEAGVTASDNLMDDSGSSDIAIPSLLDRQEGRLPFLPNSAHLPPWMCSGVGVARLTPQRMSSGEIVLTARGFNPGVCPGEEFRWDENSEAPCEPFVLHPGTYAVVRCVGERSFRALRTEPTTLGRAGGHAGLASTQPVAFAGEIEVSAQQIVLAWTLVSGTYQVPENYSAQSRLPKSFFWHFLSESEVEMSPCQRELLMLPGGNALRKPELSLVLVKTLAESPPSNREEKVQVSQHVADASRSFAFALGRGEKRVSIDLCSPSPKKRKSRDNWEQWECPLMKELRTSGDGLDLRRDVLGKAPTMWQEMLSFKTAIEKRYPRYSEYPQLVKSGILMCEMGTIATQADWNANSFLVKIMIVQLSSYLCAHESGLYVLDECGAWVPSEEISAFALTILEDACKAALCYLTKDPEELSTAFEDGTHSTLLGSWIDSGRGGEWLKQTLPKVDQKVNVLQHASWAALTAKSVRKLIPKWGNQTDTLRRNFCRWAFSSRPQCEGYVAFLDATLRFKAKSIEQVDKGTCRNCYIRIPHSLAYKPSDTFIEWFRKFFTTCISGNSDAMEVEFAIESLAAFGLSIPHHIVFYFGGGGNSKGARSKLRAAVWGNGHQWVSPGCFDVALKDEFRKQGPEIFGAMLCTLQESGSFDLDDKIFSAWTAGEGIRCRLPHAVHTPALAWPSTGKFWEINVKKTFRSKFITEASMYRRIIGIEKDATFTVDQEKMDADLKSFEAVPDLEERIASGDAVWCYLRKYFFPWYRKNDAAHARDRITRLTPSLQQQKDKLMRILIAHGTDNSENCSPQNVLESEGSMSVEFGMLKRCHHEWSMHEYVKEFRILGTTWIPGTKTVATASDSRRSRARPPSSRLDNFRAALDSHQNFFFDAFDADTFVRAPFSDIDSLLALPAEKFGTVASWKPYRRASVFGQPLHELDLEDEFRVTDDDDDDDTDILVDEIGHLPSLIEYEAKCVDRRPDVLRQWIIDLRDGVDLGGGWRLVTVPYKASHGLPGRLVPRAYAALALLTREARSVSVGFGGRCVDLDFPASHLHSLVRILQAMGILEEFPLIHMYARNYQAWRELWGKMNLTAIMYGFIPSGNAWNPVTWTLASQIHEAGLRILMSDHYSYLNSQFADRKNPFATRLYYALSADEAERLMAAKADFEGNGRHVRGLIYDGLIVESYSQDLLSKHGLLEKPLPHWEDNFFMKLRACCEVMAIAVAKIGRKRACVANSILNVGSEKAKRAVQTFEKNGPCAYGTMQRHLVQSRAMQYIQESSLAHVLNAPTGSGFILHWDEHAVGIIVDEHGLLYIFDDSYEHAGKIATSEFAALLSSFSVGGDARAFVLFALVECRYTPVPFPASFYLNAGGRRGCEASDSEEESDEETGDEEGSDSDDCGELLLAKLREEESRFLSGLNGRMRRFSQKHRDYPCELCACKVFARKVDLREHVKAVHQEEHRCASSKQLRIIRAKWSERRAAEASRVIFGELGNAPASDTMLQESAGIMRAMLQTNPSYRAIGTSKQALDCCTSWVLTSTGMMIFLKCDAAALGFKRVGDTYYTDEFLRLTLVWSMDASTRASTQSVRGCMLKHFVAHGALVPFLRPTRYVIMELQQLARSAYQHVILRSRAALIRKRMLRAISLDGTYKFLMSVQGQRKHGKAKGAQAQEGATSPIHVVLTARSQDGCIFLAKALKNETPPVVSPLLIEIPGLVDQLESLAVDRPRDWDVVAVWSKFPKLTCVVGDPMHIVYECGSCFGRTQRADIVTDLTNIMVKWCASDRCVWYSTEYFSRINGVAPAWSRSENSWHVAASYSFAQACRRLDNVDSTKGFTSRLNYLKDIHAVEVKYAQFLHKPSIQGNTLRHALERAQSAENIEYFCNGARWRCNNRVKRCDMAFGTTGNEGDHFDLKSWGRNIHKQLADRSEMVLDYWVMHKMCAHIGAMFLPRPCERENCVAQILCKVQQPVFAKGAPALSRRSASTCPWSRLQAPTVRKEVRATRAVIKRPSSSKVRHIAMKPPGGFKKLIKRATRRVCFSK